MIDQKLYFNFQQNKAEVNNVTLHFLHFFLLTRMRGMLFVWWLSLLYIGAGVPVCRCDPAASRTRLPMCWMVGSLRLRGGAKELKIEHKAFVANLPRTLTDKGLREAFEEFGKVKTARVSASL